jgi:hypothetical protein
MLAKIVDIPQLRRVVTPRLSCEAMHNVYVGRHPHHSRNIEI